ncbi:MAG: class I SAM-dependent methyltransferase [Patescibacteria group bacterium]
MNPIKVAYETAAPFYREKYAAIPARQADVDLAFSFLSEAIEPLVVEVGCAYGREAAYILTKTSRYIGIDIAQSFIAMASQELPQGTWHCLDVMEYHWPRGVDAIFAFASLLHLPKEELQVLLARMSDALQPGGVIFLSLKRRETYESSIETDQWVSRRFYYYNQATIQEITPPELTIVAHEEQERSEPWLTMILQKQGT